MWPKVNEADVCSVVSAGALLIVGAASPIVHPNDVAGLVELRLTARTRNSCPPNPSGPAYDCGEPHAVHTVVSSWHWKPVAPALENANVAFRSNVEAAGVEVSVGAASGGSGGVRASR